MPKTNKRVEPKIIEYSMIIDVLCELFNNSYKEGDWKECRMTIIKIWDVVQKEKGDGEAERVTNPFAKKLTAVK